MTTVDELDYRTRFLESEVEGEKTVTRHVLRQAGFNADDLGALRTEVRRLNEQMVLANAALTTQGGRLTLLTQDVTALRQDTTALRRGQEEIHIRLDRQDARLDAVEGRLDRMERNIAAILAAVAPGSPPPA